MKINQLVQSQHLVEGGNIFKAPNYTKEQPHMLTRDIMRSEVPATVKYLEQLLNIPLSKNLLGSTGVAAKSGDMDIAIDANQVSKDDLYNYLVAAVDDPGYVKKSGDSVHFMTPIMGDPENGFVQTDLMMVPNVAFAVWSMQSPRNSSYKGRHKQQLMADLVRTVDPNWKWNHFRGIVARDTNESVYGYNPTKIAQAVLGDTATPDDLNSVESILAKLKSNKHEQAATDAFKQTLARDADGPQLAEDSRDSIEELKQKIETAKKFGMTASVAGLVKQLNAKLKQQKTTAPLAEAANPKVGREFQHLEDLVYTEGVAGVKRAVERLLQIARNSSELEVKWDGSPAIIFGRDEQGKFHFGDKFAKQLLSTPEEVYAYYTRSNQTDGRRAFANEMAKLTRLYEAATPDDYRGFLEGGLLWRERLTAENGEYSFEPNTVRYYVKSDSELGRRVGNSTTGCAATAYFDNLPALGGQRRPVGEMYKPLNRIPQVVVIPPKFATGQAKLDTDEIKSIYTYANANRQALEQFIAPEPGFSDMRNVIYTYVNSQVDSPTLLADLGDNFAQWVQQSGKVSAPKQAKILERLRTNSKGAQVLFEVVRAIMILKDDLVDAVETDTLGSLGMRAELGRFGRGGEGFVHDPDQGVGPTKLVKRGQFTAANRSKSRDEEPVAEGEVVPFARKQPAQPLTWKQLPKQVLRLANDWYWADQDDSGLDAVMDPKGYGNGTANDVRYITAKLQQLGWSIDFNDERDKPGESNLILTNKNGQSVLLSITDAQDFRGWAAGTNPQPLEESIQRTGRSDTAVVGWGRGMGHKGHMYLASAVITTAGELGGDAYFVLSRTVGADDPLEPNEKLAIYRKVFPQHKKIFQVATDEMPDLTRVLSMLDSLGYKNVIVIVGEDQRKAFQYLNNYNGKPNKKGEVPFQFDDLQVISRQETNDPYANEDGPRATPMREILMNPDASYDEKFAVWRDAMPDRLSNVEVRSLMKKVAGRLGSPIKEAEDPRFVGGNTVSAIPGTPPDLRFQSEEEKEKHRRADAELAAMRRWMGHTND